jgi:hypothetical protein
MTGSALRCRTTRGLEEDNVGEGNPHEAADAMHAQATVSYHAPDVTLRRFPARGDLSNR